MTYDRLAFSAGECQEAARGGEPGAEDARTHPHAERAADPDGQVPVQPHSSGEARHVQAGDGLHPAALVPAAHGLWQDPGLRFALAALPLLFLLLPDLLFAGTWQDPGLCFTLAAEVDDPCLCCLCCCSAHCLLVPGRVQVLS